MIFCHVFEEILRKFWDIMGKYHTLEENLWGLKLRVKDPVLGHWSSLSKKGVFSAASIYHFAGVPRGWE